MFKKTIIALLLVMIATTGYTQNISKDSIFVMGYVADGFTKAAIPDAFVTLMRTDSTVVDTIKVQKQQSYTFGVGRGAASTRYYFKMSRTPADYIIKVEHPNYETSFTPYTIKKYSRRTYYTYVPTIYLKKAAHAHHYEGGELDEFVLKATKVKMVWRGDTLVYNADAFNMPEGSMLDGLIRQLPGVELTESGVIYVNGRQIDNLTLNGADFFKGKNKIMLDNLPYFTVKNVKVFNKQTDENKFLGINDESKKEYTMDVVLKREYSIGGSANVEAGVGTDSRYKLKGFGLRFSDRTRAVIFGGMNNINETMEYNGNNSSYNDEQQQSGDRHFRQVGGQFVYQAPENKLINSTEVNATWQDDFTETRQQSETYMSGISTFGQSESMVKSKPTQLTLNNMTQIRGGEKYRLHSNLQLNYLQQRNESEGWNLTTADAMMQDSINSSWYRSINRFDRLQGNGELNFAHKLSTGDIISLRITGDFERLYRPESWSLNHYNYYKQGNSDKRDRRTKKPNRHENYSAQLKYTYQLTEAIDLTPLARIEVGDRHSDCHEYLRDSIDYLFDQQNSYDQRTQTMDKTVGLSMSIYKETEHNYIGLLSSFNANFQRQRMDYTSVPLTTSTTRHYTLLTPNVFLFLNSRDMSYRFNILYNMRSSTPGITDLIDRPITSDPLNIFLGNPNLKTSQEHRFSAEYSLRCDSIDQNINISADGTLVHNARSQSYTYDLNTGIRTYRPENIGSGNWKLGTKLSWSRAVGKHKFWHVDNTIRLAYEKSTGFATIQSAEATQQPQRSRVDNLYIRYKPNLSFQKGAFSFCIKGEMTYRNIHRNITIGDQPTDIWDFSYGFNGTYKLPWQLTFETDLTMNSHRGYADNEMNDNRLYWDAALTKSIHKGQWVIKLRGYDLLGQVSNLRYAINAQGRTETWTNSMRRYALLTVSYRFSQKPKKK